MTSATDTDFRPMPEAGLDQMTEPIDGRMSGLWAAGRYLRDLHSRRPMSRDELLACLQLIDMSSYCAGQSVNARYHVLNVTAQALGLPDRFLVLADRTFISLSGQKVSQ